MSTAPKVRAAFLAEHGGLVLNLPIADSDARRTRDSRTCFRRPRACSARWPTCPGCAQPIRIRARGCATRRGREAIRHCSIHRNCRPMREPLIEVYEFVRVEGDGVHEIAVGPVHAGTIEPGHFRFSVVGEKVLRLEERLGYAHKGIERRFTRASASSRRIGSPHACRAIPPWRSPGPTARRSKASRAPKFPPRAAWLRALYLELERIANHLGDLGALGNDAGFAFGLTQFSRLKETAPARQSRKRFGERYLMDAVVPGGTRCDPAAQASTRCRCSTVQEIAHEVADAAHHL